MKTMKIEIKKGLLAMAVLLCLIIFSLAFIPHYACACGQYEDSSYMTHFFNSVSEKVLGKPVIEKNEKPDL